jgi:hypothetical protein
MRTSDLRIVRDGLSATQPSSNWLLASLPPPVVAHLTPHWERIRLQMQVCNVFQPVEQRLIRWLVAKTTADSRSSNRGLSRRGHES